jgi:hypothetical protein
MRIEISDTECSYKPQQELLVYVDQVQRNLLSKELLQHPIEELYNLELNSVIYRQRMKTN